MKLIKSLENMEKKHIIFIEGLFILYIIFNISTPIAAAKIIDSRLGMIITVLLAIMFFTIDPIAGALALIVAYLLIKRAGLATGSISNDSNSSEASKIKILESYNDFPRSLEEDVVANMAPIISSKGQEQSTYKPVLDKLNDAAPIDYAGVN